MCFIKVSGLASSSSQRTEHRTCAGLARPTNIIELSAITSIYRPGPLSANVDKLYLRAKEHIQKMLNMNTTSIKQVTEETYGFLIFQEQIALLAHHLGRDLSLWMKAISCVSSDQERFIESKARRKESDI
jgi:hypothetical protein